MIKKKTKKPMPTAKGKTEKVMIKKKTKKPMPTAKGKTKKAKAPTKKAGSVKGSRGPAKKPVPKKYAKAASMYNAAMSDIINKTKKKKVKA